MNKERFELAFKGVSFFCAFIVLIIIAGFFMQFLWSSLPSIKTFGFDFLYSKTWDPGKDIFSALPSLYGTLVTTFIALLIAVPMSFVITLFLVEYAHPVVSEVIGQLLDLLAAIPSIIFGMWGLFIFVPIMQEYVQPLLAKFSFIPFFTGKAQGLGFLTSGLILALMILPFISSVMRNIFKMVPNVIREASFGVGSTTLEVNFHILIKYCFSGIIGAIFLGMGRALGETMAVTYVIGNNHAVSASWFSPGTTIAATLANDFGEASGILYNSLIELAFILFLMSFVIQILTNMWLNKIKKEIGSK